MFENFQAPLSGQTVGGEMGFDQLAEMQAELNKSLTAGYGSDMASLTGGSAFRIQSLDKTMQATIVDNPNFTLFNKIAKNKADAVLDEWTEQSDIGGFPGGTTNDQDGNASEGFGTYARMVGKVKYLMTYRKIPIVLQRQNNMVDAVGIEASNGAKQLLRDIEVLMWDGDDTVVPTEFPGVRKQIIDLASSDNIIDMNGAPLDSIEPISRAAEVIFGIDSFGQATDIFTGTSVQTDLNNHMDPAFRVALDNSPNSVMLGTHVRGLQTSYGAIATNQDVFIRDERTMKPFEIKYAATATANDTFKPQAVSPAAANDATSNFLTATAGDYYYAVAGVTKNGQSTVLVSAKVSPTAGQKVTLTITASAGGTETGYVIYRSRKGGTNAVADLREMARVPKDVSGTTTYVDKNTNLPGTTTAYVLNMRPSDHAISWQQFLPMMKIPMAAVQSPIIPWLQMICGYLRITKRRQHVIIKNIVPSNALWKPYG